MSQVLGREGVQRCQPIDMRRLSTKQLNSTTTTLSQEWFCAAIIMIKLVFVDTKNFAEKHIISHTLD